MARLLVPEQLLHREHQKEKDAPLDVILAHVGWLSAETFRKFYDKPFRPANNIMASAIWHSNLT